MKQALAALAGAGLTAAACYAAGTLLIDRLGARLRRIERFPLAFLVGAALLHLAVFLILTLHVAYWPVLLALLLAAIGAAVWTGSWKMQGLESQRLSRPLQVLIGLTAGAFFTVYFFNAWAPEHSPDGSTYHLGLVARYLRARGFETVTTSIYGMLGAGIEMLFVPAFAIGRHSAAALTQLAFGVVLAMAMLAYGRRLGKPWVGAAGALLTFLSPVVGRSASIAYVDVATAAVVFGVFYWLEIWSDQRDEPGSWRLLIPVGLLAGYAYAAKYTTFPIGLFALGYVAWRSRGSAALMARRAGLVAVFAVVMAGPWVIRNWVVYGNPVAPLGNWLFRNPNVHVMFEKEYSAYLRRYAVENKWELPLEVTARGQRTTGLIGPVFLLLPLALFALRYPAGRRLLLAGTLVFSTYFANIGTRFLIPCLPFFSLALAMALGKSPPLLGALVAFHAVASWPTVIPRYASPYAWRIDDIPYLEALRIVPQDEYLRRVHSGYPVARMIDEHVPEGARVLTTTGIPDAYTRAEILVNFQAAENEVLTDILQNGWLRDNQPALAHVLRFPARQVSRIRVRQTAPGEYPVQWNVHELRLFSGGAELPRDASWRLRAWPNPWDVQMAFDNSPVTRWRSWETAGPGMYIDIDLGEARAVDQVRLEGSFDSSILAFAVEVLNDAGDWERLDAQDEQVSISPPQPMRRMATYELYQRGIQYLVMAEDDFGARDIAQDTEAWGLEVVDRVGPVTLYQTIWDRQSPWDPPAEGP